MLNVKWLSKFLNSKMYYRYRYSCSMWAQQNLMCVAALKSQWKGACSYKQMHLKLQQVSTSMPECMCFSSGRHDDHLEPLQIRLGLCLCIHVISWDARCCGKHLDFWGTCRGRVHPYLGTPPPEPPWCSNYQNAWQYTWYIAILHSVPFA